MGEITIFLTKRIVHSSDCFGLRCIVTKDKILFDQNMGHHGHVCGGIN